MNLRGSWKLSCHVTGEKTEALVTQEHSRKGSHHRPWDFKPKGLSTSNWDMQRKASALSRTHVDPDRREKEQTTQGQGCFLCLSLALQLFIINPGPIH